MRIKTDESGASAVEYGLIVVAIAAVIVVVVFVLGGYTLGMFDGTCTELDDQGMTNASGDVCP